MGRAVRYSPLFTNDLQRGPTRRRDCGVPDCKRFANAHPLLSRRITPGKEVKAVTLTWPAGVGGGLRDTLGQMSWAERLALLFLIVFAIGCASC